MITVIFSLVLLLAVGRLRIPCDIAVKIQLIIWGQRETRNLRTAFKLIDRFCFVNNQLAKLNAMPVKSGCKIHRMVVDTLQTAPNIKKKYIYICNPGLEYRRDGVSAGVG